MSRALDKATSRIPRDGGPMTRLTSATTRPLVEDPSAVSSGRGDVPAASRPTPSQGLISAVRAYQMARAGRPTGCRYLPTCSEYAVEAIDVHGAAEGTWLAVRRICPLHPVGRPRFDPVPERSTP